MMIDWFTVAAQTLNFLVLVWLMKRFLYKPVLDAIDVREKRIADQLADAAAKEALADADRAAFQGKSDAFDQERGDLLAQARANAQAEAQRLMDEAQQAAHALREKRQAALAAETRQVNQALADRATQEVLAISRKALADLASQDLEAHIIEVFLGRLHRLPDTAKTLIDKALNDAPDTAIVRSTFALTPKQCASVQTAFNEVFQTVVPLHFDVAPEPLCGIELTVGGQKLAWSINQYLAEMEGTVAQLRAPVASIQAAP